MYGVIYLKSMAPDYDAKHKIKGTGRTKSQMKAQRNPGRHLQKKKDNAEKPHILQCTVLITRQLSKYGIS